MLHLTAYTYLALTASLSNHLGEMKRARGEYQAAAIDFSRAVALAPSDPVGLYNLATVYRRLGRFSEAERLARRTAIIWTKPGNLAAAYNLLGGLLADQGHYREALRAYDTSLAFESRDSGAVLMNRALVLNSLRRYGDAKRDLLRACRELSLGYGDRDSRTISCTNALGFVAYQSRRYAEAETWLLRAISLREQTVGMEHPELAASLTNLGAVYVAQGRWAEAEAALIRSMRIQSGSLGVTNPHTIATMMEYAKVLRATRRKAEAARIEAQARQAGSGFRGYTVDLGVLGN